MSGSVLEDCSKSSSSSTTEGPDSSVSSATSSPTRAAAAAMAGLPKFAVSVVDVVKSGDHVNFRLEVRRVRSQDENSWQIERRYEDFVGLHQVIAAQTNLDGLIVPPIPPKTQNDLRRGANSRVMAGDDFASEQRFLERFMTDLLMHPRFGHDANLANFLEQQGLPKRTGSISNRFRLPNVFGEARLSSNPESDPFFESEKSKASKLGQSLIEISDKFSQMLQIQGRLANQTSQLAVALGASINCGALLERKSENSSNNDSLREYNRLNSALGKYLEEDRREQDNLIEIRHATLGHYWQIWKLYLISENDMLSRRNQLQLECEAADKSYVKAKPEKMATLRNIREEKTNALDRCSRTAKEEILRLHENRLGEMRDILMEHAENEVQCAKSHLETLDKGLKRLNQLT